jgi:hypothetical protein
MHLSHVLVTFTKPKRAYLKPSNYFADDSRGGEGEHQVASGPEICTNYLGKDIPESQKHGIRVVREITELDFSMRHFRCPNNLISGAKIQRILVFHNQYSREMYVGALSKIQSFTHKKSDSIETLS